MFFQPIQNKLLLLFNGTNKDTTGNNNNGLPTPFKNIKTVGVSQFLVTFFAVSWDPVTL